MRLRAPGTVAGHERNSKDNNCGYSRNISGSIEKLVVALTGIENKAVVLVHIDCQINSEILEETKTISAVFR